MKNKLVNNKQILHKSAVLALLFFSFLGFGLANVPGRASAVSEEQFRQLAAKKDKDVFSKVCKKDFFGLVPWYAYMPQSNFNYDYFGYAADPNNQPNPCSIKCFNVFNQTVANDCGQTKSDIPGVLLAIVDDLLRIAGIVAVAYVIAAGFQYVRSEGKPDDTAKAQSMLVNALLGLAIAIISVAFVSFVGNKLGG